jgi:hypothetical protein
MFDLFDHGVRAVRNVLHIRFSAVGKDGSELLERTRQTGAGIGDLPDGLNDFGPIRQQRQHSKVNFRTVPSILRLSSAYQRFTY